MKVFLVIVFAFISVAVVDCLQCYECSNCNDPFKESSSTRKVSCSSGQCMKTKGKVGDVQVVSRSCSAIKLDNKCTEQKSGEAEAEVCFCDTELCNGSPAFGISLKLPLLLAAVVVIITALKH